MRTLVLSLAVSVVVGCSLVSRGQPLEVRYFSPETLGAAVPARAPTAHRGPPVARLRLGRVSPSANLRYAIVHRESSFELAPYETRQWTETPDAYVRRSLERALFEARPLQHVVGGDAPTLEIEVIAFEEVQTARRHTGRVQLGYQLVADDAVLASGVVTGEREIRGTGFETVVAAIAAAMEDATSQVAELVLRRVCPPTGTQPCAPAKPTGTETEHGPVPQI
jgi:cholesterol transport system auxiliary component